MPYRYLPIIAYVYDIVVTKIFDCPSFQLLPTSKEVRLYLFSAFNRIEKLRLLVEDSCSWPLTIKGLSIYHVTLAI